MKREANGHFGKGNKFGGRRKGTHNRTTHELKDFFNKFLNRHVGDLDTAFAELEAKDKFKVILNMTKFVMPTLKAQGSTLEELTDAQFDAIVGEIKKEFQLN